MYCPTGTEAKTKTPIVIGYQTPPGTGISAGDHLGFGECLLRGVCHQTVKFSRRLRLDRASGTENQHCYPTLMNSHGISHLLSNSKLRVTSAAAGLPVRLKGLEFPFSDGLQGGLGEDRVAGYRSGFIDGPGFADNGFDDDPSGNLQLPGYHWVNRAGLLNGSFLSVVFDDFQAGIRG